MKRDALLSAQIFYEIGNDLRAIERGMHPGKNIDNIIDVFGFALGVLFPLAAAFFPLSVGIPLTFLGFLCVLAGVFKDHHNRRIFDRIRRRYCGFDPQKLRLLVRTLKEHDSEVARIDEIRGDAERLRDSLGEAAAKQLDELIAVRAKDLATRKLLLEAEAIAFMETARLNWLMRKLEARGTIETLAPETDRGDLEIELGDNPERRRAITEARAQVEIARLTKTTG